MSMFLLFDEFFSKAMKLLHPVAFLAVLLCIKVSQYITNSYKNLVLLAKNVCTSFPLFCKRGSKFMHKCY